MTRLLIIAIAAAATACAPTQDLQRISSGRIGCSPPAIQIADFHLGTASSWTATCEGKTYFCSGGGEDIVCTPATK